GWPLHRRSAVPLPQRGRRDMKLFHPRDSGGAGAGGR
ncbi:MAG: hypothetical protein ACOVOE_02470, partial [Caulobacter sp.]